MDRTDEEAQGGQVTLKQDHLWPFIIGATLAVVIIVNVIFIYIAVTGADEVTPSYVEGER